MTQNYDMNFVVYHEPCIGSSVKTDNSAEDGRLQRHTRKWSEAQHDEGYRWPEVAW